MAILIAAAVLTGSVVTAMPLSLRACGPNDETPFVTFNARQVKQALALVGSL
jgi:hypothetical protein